MADIFFARLSDGAGLPTNSPILLLRNRLIQDRYSRAKLPRDEVCALIIKAWNAYATGKPIKALRWYEGADEAFPIPLDGTRVPPGNYLTYLLGQ